MSARERWISTVAVEELDAEYPSMAVVEDFEVVLCRAGDEVFALNNICSHAFARLSDGWVEGGEIFCPLHQGSFDIRTGQAIASPCFEPVTSYPTKIEDGLVHVCPQPRPSFA